MIEVGQKVQFDQFDYIQSTFAEAIKGHLVVGTVAYVNKPHKWFSVEYGNLRTSYKFSQIGTDVMLCG